MGAEVEIDGILGHESSANLSTLHIDGGGVSDIIFAVMSMLGHISRPVFVGPKRGFNCTMIKAQDVVNDIAQGVRNALRVSQELLGAEAIYFE